MYWKRRVMEIACNTNDINSRQKLTHIVTLYNKTSIQHVIVKIFHRTLKKTNDLRANLIHVMTRLHVAQHGGDDDDDGGGSDDDRAA